MPSMIDESVRQVQTVLKAVAAGFDAAGGREDGFEDRV